MTAVLERIRRALGVTGAEADRRKAVAERLARHPPGPRPAIAEADAATLLSEFRERIEARAATVEQVPTRGAAVAAVQSFLAQHGLAPAAVLSRALEDLDWATLRVEARPPRPDDRVGIASADLAIAETGSLVFFARPESPITLAFVPGTHIVLLPESRIIGPLEGLWDYQRAHFSELPPRAVTLVSGPSRTADIEQTIELGAHGPKRLHVILIGSQPSP
ncbi:MAG: lactate utilization protein C [Rhodothalassiaceae bacterium]